MYTRPASNCVAPEFGTAVRFAFLSVACGVLKKVVVHKHSGTIDLNRAHSTHLVFQYLLSLLTVPDVPSSTASKASSLFIDRSFSSDPDIDADVDIARGGEPPLLELLEVSAACQQSRIQHQGIKPCEVRR